MTKPQRQVYKLLRAEEWAAFEATGRFDGSADDRRDGFIHLSAADQVEGTRERHFAGETGLVRVALDADSLGEALRWEVSRRGAAFPHLYRPLLREEVVESIPL